MELPLKLRKGTPWRTVPGDDHHVDHRPCGPARKAPEGFPYPSLDPVPSNRLLGHPLADRHPKPGAAAATLLPEDDQVLGGEPTAVLLYGLVLRAPPQLGGHWEGLIEGFARPMIRRHRGASSVPALLLRRTHGESLSASAASPREHQSTVLGPHPAPEPVASLPALVVRLIWALHGLGSSSWTCIRPGLGSIPRACSTVKWLEPWPDSEAESFRLVPSA